MEGGLKVLPIENAISMSFIRGSTVLSVEYCWATIDNGWNTYVLQYTIRPFPVYPYHEDNLSIKNKMAGSRSVHYSEVPQHTHITYSSLRGGSEGGYKPQAVKETGIDSVLVFPPFRGQFVRYATKLSGFQESFK